MQFVLCQEYLDTDLVQSASTVFSIKWDKLCGERYYVLRLILLKSRTCFWEHWPFLRSSSTWQPSIAVCACMEHYFSSENLALFIIYIYYGYFLLVWCIRSVEWNCGLWIVAKQLIVFKMKMFWEDEARFLLGRVK